MGVRYSQHFLTDPNIARKIVEAARLRPSDHVVEIGSGRGALTGLLLATGGTLTAIEIDQKLADLLEKEFSRFENFRLHRADVLSFHFENLAPFIVVSNLPYAIASPLLFRLLASREKILRMVLMFQREVAGRIASRPGEAEWGPLGVAARLTCGVERLFNVPRTCFTPRPKVDSTLLKLTPLPAPAVPLRDEQFFLSTVRRIFSYRRKTLKNSLIAAGISPAVVQQAGHLVDLALRPQVLSLEQMAKLIDFLFDNRS